MRSKLYHLTSLDIINVVRREVRKKMKVRHKSYSIQVNPCDYCHFCTAVEKKGEEEVIERSSRAGHPSAAKQGLLMVMGVVVPMCFLASACTRR